MPESTEEMPQATSFRFLSPQSTGKKLLVWHSPPITNICMLHTKKTAFSWMFGEKTA